jgi:hypothetical protein
LDDRRSPEAVSLPGEIGGQQRTEVGAETRICVGALDMRSKELRKRRVRRRQIWAKRLLQSLSVESRCPIGLEVRETLLSRVEKD